MKTTPTLRHAPGRITQRASQTIAVRGISPSSTQEPT